MVAGNKQFRSPSSNPSPFLAKMRESGRTIAKTATISFRVEPEIKEQLSKRFGSDLNHVLYTFCATLAQELQPNAELNPPGEPED